MTDDPTPKAFCGSARPDHHSSMAALLPHLGFTYEKLLLATERPRTKVRHESLTRGMPTMRLHPDRVVFIDETTVKTNLIRLQGRAMRGENLKTDAPFGTWAKAKSPERVYSDFVGA